MSLQLHLLVKILTLFFVIYGTLARPMFANPDMLNTLESIFKVGDGIMVYNVGIPSEALENDEIVCAERRAGKSYCKEVENYIEAVRLDKIDPEQFAKFKQYFTDDLEQPQTVVTTRMDFDESPCNSKTQIIYPKAAISTDAQWLLVVQYGQYKQGVLVEECEYEVGPGEDILRSKQNFNYRRMVVLVYGEMKVKLVKLPSRCECRI